MRDRVKGRNEGVEKREREGTGREKGISGREGGE